MNHQIEWLQNYIQENRQQGHSDQSIKHALLNAGWSASDIDNVMFPATSNNNAFIRTKILLSVRLLFVVEFLFFVLVTIAGLNLARLDAVADYGLSPWELVKWVNFSFAGIVLALISAARLYCVVRMRFFEKIALYVYSSLLFLYLMIEIILYNNRSLKYYLEDALLGNSNWKGKFFEFALIIPLIAWVWVRHRRKFI